MEGWGRLGEVSKGVEGERFWGLCWEEKDQSELDLNFHMSDLSRMCKRRLFGRGFVHSGKVDGSWGGGSLFSPELISFLFPALNYLPQVSKCSSKNAYNCLDWAKSFPCFRASRGGRCTF